MALLAFLIVGLVAALLARGASPGNRRMRSIGTVALGVIGSLVGGLGTALITRQAWLELQPTGLVFSGLGAMLVLAMVRRRPDLAV